MAKKTQNEGLFSATKRFSDAFFDGLKNNQTKKFLSKAQTSGVPPKVVQQMRKLEKEKQELDNIIKKYSK
tara:strand:- start:414 stop:623 length:210 start_codon:yes stop_codon:yes gene_type:complete